MRHVAPRSFENAGKLPLHCLHTGHAPRGAQELRNADEKPPLTLSTHVACPHWLHSSFLLCRWCFGPPLFINLTSILRNPNNFTSISCILLRIYSNSIHPSPRQIQLRCSLKIRRLHNKMAALACGVSGSVAASPLSAASLSSAAAFATAPAQFAPLRNVNVSASRVVAVTASYSEVCFERLHIVSM